MPILQWVNDGDARREAKNVPFHRNAARKLATLVARGIAAKLDFEGLPYFLLNVVGMM